MSIAEFITANGLTMVVTSARRNPNMADSASMTRHFVCTLKAGELGTDYRDMNVPFSQGSAHTKEPTLAEVLDCLASDAASIENARGFEDWASDFGYDSDSRKAEKTYDTCVRQCNELRDFLGGPAFSALLVETDRE